nr:ORF3 [Bacillus subtilis subsp. amylosacchariticus]
MTFKSEAASSTCFSMSALLSGTPFLANSSLIFAIRAAAFSLPILSPSSDVVTSSWLATCLTSSEIASSEETSYALINPVKAAVPDTSNGAVTYTFASLTPAVISAFRYISSVMPLILWVSTFNPEPFLAMVIDDEEIALDPICAFDIYFLNIHVLPYWSRLPLWHYQDIHFIKHFCLSDSDKSAPSVTMTSPTAASARLTSEPSAAKRPLPAFQSKFSSKQFDLLQFHKQLDSAAL